jgi:hypothetical protein
VGGITVAGTGAGVHWLAVKAKRIATMKMAGDFFMTAPPFQVEVAMVMSHGGLPSYSAVVWWLNSL